MKDVDAFGFYKQSARKLARVLYGSNSPRHKKWAARIEKCDIPRKRTQRTCNVRICCVCQWKTSRRLKARFYNNILVPTMSQYPSRQFLLLTFTVDPCKAKFIKNTIHDMTHAVSHVMSESYLAHEGYFYIFRVDRVGGYLARVLLHCLILTRMEINDEQWQRVPWEQRFREHIGADYFPFVRVVEIRPDLFTALIKPLAIDFHGEKTLVRKYLLALTDNIHNVKMLSHEGIFKQYWHDYDLPRHVPKFGAPISAPSKYGSGYETELFASEDLNAEERIELIETICDRLQQERAMSREEALDIIREAM